MEVKIKLQDIPGVTPPCRNVVVPGNIRRLLGEQDDKPSRIISWMRHRTNAHSPQKFNLFRFE